MRVKIKKERKRYKHNDLSGTGNIRVISRMLEPISILIDRNQTVQIILSGSLKEETQLEKIMDQVRKMPFDEVMRALFGQ